MTAGLDLVAAPTLTPAHGKYSGRLNALIYGVDAALVAARDGSLGGWLFGMDFKADMEAGITAEVIYHQPDYGGLGWTKAAAGLDWSVGDFILATEYYFNGGGSKADLLYPGTNNLTASVTWDVSQLVKLMASVTGDMDRRTGVATFTTTISAAQNADLTGFIQAGNGIAGYGIGYSVNGASWMVQTGLGLAVKF